MECDLFDVVDVDAGAISTHALTWSATEFKTKNPQILKISTHALTWSATDGVVECDDYVKISTHALTWSATCYCPVCVCLVQFQLTHSREVRHAVTSAQGGGRRFQLTHSRGVRHDPADIIGHNGDFNSRTHVECDKIKKSPTLQCRDFNSRTHVECDTAPPPAADCTKISTHALTWSATSANNRRPIRIRFQLTHSRGVRPSAIRWRNRTEEISTHALTWSATFRGGMAFWICQISTHALTWSATRLYDICRL